MENTQVRIGNIVNINNSVYNNKPRKVDIDLLIDWDINNPKPIPLTDEILTKLGFEKSENSMFINGFAYKMQIDADAYHKDTVLYEGIGGHCYKKTGKLFLSVFRAGNYVGKSVEFLHEFQNHWFALTALEYNCSSVLG